MIGGSPEAQSAMNAQEATASSESMTFDVQKKSRGGRWQIRQYSFDAERHMLLMGLGKAQKRAVHVSHFKAEDTEGADAAHSQCVLLQFVPGAFAEDTGHTQCVAFTSRPEKMLFLQTWEKVCAKASAEGSAPQPGASIDATRQMRTGSVGQVVASVSAAGASAATAAKLMALKAADYALLQFEIFKLKMDMDQELFFIKLRSRGWQAQVATTLVVGAFETTTELEADYSNITMRHLPRLAQTYASVQRDYLSEVKARQKAFKRKWRNLQAGRAEDEDSGGEDADGGAEDDMAMEMPEGNVEGGAEDAGGAKEGEEHKEKGVSAVIGRVETSAAKFERFAVSGTVSAAFEIAFAVQGFSALSFEFRLELSVSISSVFGAAKRGMTGGTVNDAFAFASMYAMQPHVMDSGGGFGMHQAAMGATIATMLAGSMMAQDAEKPVMGPARSRKLLEDANTLVRGDRDPEAEWQQHKSSLRLKGQEDSRTESDDEEEEDPEMKEQEEVAAAPVAAPAPMDAAPAPAPGEYYADSTANTAQPQLEPYPES